MGTSKNRRELVQFVSRGLASAATEPCVGNVFRHLGMRAARPRSGLAEVPRFAFGIPQAVSEVCALDARVLVATTSLLEAHPLRAMDALHIACALSASPDRFASAVQRQLVGVKKSGLAVLDVS